MFQVFQRNIAKEMQFLKIFKPLLFLTELSWECEFFPVLRSLSAISKKCSLIDFVNAGRKF